MSYLPPRSRALLVSLALLAALVPGATLALPGSAEVAEQADTSWVDQPLETLQPWNQAGAPLPDPVPDSGVNPRCDGLGRWAETPQDQLLLDAGWHLFAPFQAGWGIAVVGARSGEDGMCRPLGYQYFVFVDGSLAGTIAPVAMDSRATGAGSIVTVRQDSLTARFLRYAPTDPLCCPSRGAVVVDYRVDRTPDGPVLTPVRRFEEPAPARS